jgi:hypothetical protein
MVGKLFNQNYENMGRQRGVKMVGTIGNVIFYNYLGEYCMRTKPASVKRTESSIHAGLNFGKACRIAKQVRSQLATINPSKSDIRMIYRFNGVLNKFITWKEKIDKADLKVPRVLPYIQDFQFNEEGDLSSMRSIKAIMNPAGSDERALEFAPFTPDRDLFAPGQTDHIFFKSKLIRINLADTETNLLAESETEIHYSDTIFQPAAIRIPDSLKPGDLVILILAIQYMVNRKGEIELLEDKKKMPCGILWAGLF